MTARRWSAARSGPTSARATASAASSPAAARSASWADDHLDGHDRQLRARTPPAGRRRRAAGRRRARPAAAARRPAWPEHGRGRGAVVVGARTHRRRGGCVVRSSALGQLRGVEDAPGAATVRSIRQRSGWATRWSPSAVDPPSTPKSRPRRPWSIRSARSSSPAQAVRSPSRPVAESASRASAQTRGRGRRRRRPTSQVGQRAQLGSVSRAGPPAGTASSAPSHQPRSAERRALRRRRRDRLQPRGVAGGPRGSAMSPGRVGVAVPVIVRTVPGPRAVTGSAGTSPARTGSRCDGSCPTPSACCAGRSRRRARRGSRP